MRTPNSAQRFLDDLYAKYKARKGKPLVVETGQDKIIVSEYKPVSARTLQRKGRDYSSFIVSPFEPINIKREKLKEKNPLILESSVEEKPKLDFSLLEWINQVESNLAVQHSTLGFYEGNTEISAKTFYNYGYLIADDNLNFIANRLEGLIAVLKTRTEDSNGDGNISIKEIFEQNANNTDQEGTFLGSVFSELLFDFDDPENPKILVMDQFLDKRNVRKVDQLGGIIFSFKELKKIYTFPKDQEGLEVFDNFQFPNVSGYHYESLSLNQYSINLKSIFLLKNKNFYSVPGVSNVILVLSAELNKSYKEQILNLQNDLFRKRSFYLLDDRDETEIRKKSINFMDFYFTKNQNIKILSFPIVNPEVLKSINLINNYELLNNYLTEQTFKPDSNPINLIGFQNFEYKKIIFTQEELINAKFIDSNGAINGDGPGIFIEGENTFKAVLKKYLIYEYNNLIEDFSSYTEGTPVRENNSIYYVLIELLWKKIKTLFDKGVIFKVNYPLSTEKNKEFYSYLNDLNPILKYSNQILYIALNNEKYYSNFFALNSSNTLLKGSLEELKNAFFTTLYEKIMEFVFLTTSNSNLNLSPGNAASSFENYLNSGEITLNSGETYLAENLLPSISIVYSEEDMTNIESSTISGLHERTQWSTVVDFARDQNLKSNSIEGENVAKLKDFLNKLSLKIETIINKNKEKGVLTSWERVVSIGNYNIDFTDVPEGDQNRLWRVKDQHGNIINDYFDIAMPLILTEFHIINVKTLSKFKTRQKCLKTLSKIKENEDFEAIKNGFLIIRNSVPSLIELFNRFYDPNYFVDKAFKQKNSKEIQNKLEATKSSLESLIGKTAIVKVDGKVGIIYNFDPLICYKADSDLLTIILREQQAGNQLASISADYGRIYPILYPYSNVRVTNDEETTFYPNLLGFYNLWDEATGTESDGSDAVKRKHISFPGYYEENSNKFSGYNFKNMPVLSASIYSRHAMVAPENPERRTVIDQFYIINDPSGFSPRAEIPRLTEILYERYHRNRSLKIELKVTGNQSLVKEIKKENLENKANLVLGMPVFFLSEKVKSEDVEYFANKETFVDLNQIEAIYFFDKKDYNPRKEISKNSSKNTAYSTRAKR
jgi:hypothetical protein